MLQKNLNYSFNGYQVPVIPRGSRSTRVINCFYHSDITYRSMFGVSLILDEL